MNENVIAGQMGRLLLQADGRWLHFTHPRQIITAHTAAEVRPALSAIAAAVEKGRYAAGYLSYEAAGGLDLAVHTPHSAPPLLWFGLYERVAELSELPPPDAGAPVPTPDWQPAISKATYLQAIDQIKGQIARGHTYQVNYTFPLLSDFHGDPFAYFHQLVRAQQAAYAAYLDLGRWAICSASPELFFTLDGEKLQSKPMKGTAERGLTFAADEQARADLAVSEKNRAENVMIVDMIRNDMGRVARTGSVRVPALFQVERYPTLLQMTSTVTAQTAAPLDEILAGMFPCASITGAPKIRTMEIIRELEAEPRGVYTGAIGYIAPGRRAQFNVAIRTVVVDREAETAVYGVGSGIVWDSDGAAEYAECRLKGAVLTAQRPPFSLLESLLWTPADDFFLWEAHLRRLEQSARYFQFPFDPEKITRALQNGVQSLAAPHKVRLALAADGTAVVTTAPIILPAPGEVLRLGLAREPVDRGAVWLYHKTTRREVYARAWDGRADCDEVLLWNEAGELTEATTANIVLQLDGELLTPPVESGLLAGTFREHLLAAGTIRAQTLTLADLNRADAIFLINSVRKWREGVLSATSALVG